MIAEAVWKADTTGKILEIGPGKGALTKYLFAPERHRLKVVEIDTRMVSFLQEHFPGLEISHQDFLEAKPEYFFEGQFSLCGNFPYNISSQILFRLLEYRAQIPVMTGMFQQEVASRICSGHGRKDYGILSVLVQACYDPQYLFTVAESSFDPPPRVKSGVIQLTRKAVSLVQDEAFFIRVVKAAFNQRRKMLSNSLAGILGDYPYREERVLKLRPEQLSVDDFILLAENIKAAK